MPLHMCGRLYAPWGAGGGRGRIQKTSCRIPIFGSKGIALCDLLAIPTWACWNVSRRWMHGGSQDTRSWKRARMVFCVCPSQSDRCAICLSRMAGDRVKRESKPVDKYSPPAPVVSEKPKKKKAIKVKATKVKKTKGEKKTGEKKPLVGYMLFCKHHREEAKKKLPKGLESKAVMPAIAKILGEMWGKLSDAHKASWKEGKVVK